MEEIGIPNRKIPNLEEHAMFPTKSLIVLCKIVTPIVCYWYI